MTVHALILAAGSGTRYGGGRPKQFELLGRKPILLWSVAAFASAGVERLVVVAPPDWLDQTRALVETAVAGVPVEIVPGGGSRRESSRVGLQSLSADENDIVAIHDAARPLVAVALIQRVLAPVAGHRADGCAPAVGSPDTVARLAGEAIVEIPPRADLARLQTPQAFRVPILRAAHASAAAAGDTSTTDDCGLVLRHVPGARIIAVPGDEDNIKVTTELDRQIAEAILGRDGPRG